MRVWSCLVVASFWVDGGMLLIRSTSMYVTTRAWPTQLMYNRTTITDRSSSGRSILSPSSSPATARMTDLEVWTSTKDSVAYTHTTLANIARHPPRITQCHVSNYSVRAMRMVVYTHQPHYILPIVDFIGLSPQPPYHSTCGHSFGVKVFWKPFPYIWPPTL